MIKTAQPSDHLCPSSASTPSQRCRCDSHWIKAKHNESVVEKDRMLPCNVICARTEIFIPSKEVRALLLELDRFTDGAHAICNLCRSNGIGRWPVDLHVLLDNQNQVCCRRKVHLATCCVLSSAIGLARMVFRVLELALQPCVRVLERHFGVGVDDAAVAGLYSCVDLCFQLASFIHD